MALVDADYKFIWIDMGGNDSASNAQIFNSSELRECIRYPGNPPLDRDNANHEIIPGGWRDNVDHAKLQRLRGTVGTGAARWQRLYLKKYYSSEVGAEPWQNDMI